MQKLLILGTALIAAGMLAHGPAAAENIKLSLSGHFNAAVMVIDQDLDVNTRNHAFDREAEIFFRGSTILDNGLTVGVNVELEAESIIDQIDETYLYFKGGFGEIRLGQDDGAMQAMGIYPASAGHSMYGVLFPSHTYVTGGSLVGEGAFGLGPDYDAEKIAWYSPRVGGLTIGLSYTPDAGEATGRGTPVSGAGSSDIGEQSEVVGVGANWTGAFAGGNVSAGGGYSRASLESPSPTADTDRTEWIAGLSATKDGITVSGNYSVDNQGLIGNNDRTTLAIGATYSMNPWLLGVTFGNTERATHRQQRNLVRRPVFARRRRYDRG